MSFISAIVAFLIAIGAYFVYGSYHAEAPTSSSERTDAVSEQTTSTLASLDRSGQNLTELPKDILAMTHLQRLDLSHNSLSGALPAEIRHLNSLEVLDISHNKMTGLPAEIGQLSRLRVLNASNNQLTGIPHELGNLQNLELLDLSGNNISSSDIKIIREKLPATVEIRL